MAVLNHVKRGNKGECTREPPAPSASKTQGKAHDKQQDKQPHLPGQPGWVMVEGVATKAHPANGGPGHLHGAKGSKGDHTVTRAQRAAVYAPVHST